MEAIEAALGAFEDLHIRMKVTREGKTKIIKADVFDRMIDECKDRLGVLSDSLEKNKDAASRDIVACLTILAQLARRILWAADGGTEEERKRIFRLFVTFDFPVDLTRPDYGPKSAEMAKYDDRDNVIASLVGPSVK